MEQSEIQEKAINLGKSFIKELGVDNRGDTLSRWMAHYLAELMTKAESAKGAEKKRLDKECFDCILALWKHRWTLPHGASPLENFEPLLNLLQKLDPEKDEPYFYPKVPEQRKIKQSKKSKEDIDWLKLAESIDKIARIWLSEVLHQAAKSMEKPNTKAWLENAVIMPKDHDREIIVRIITEKMPDPDDEESMRETQDRLTKETIEDRIRQLAGFSELNQLLLEIYTRQLK